MDNPFRQRVAEPLKQQMAKPQAETSALSYGELAFFHPARDSATPVAYTLEQLERKLRAPGGGGGAAQRSGKPAVTPGLSERLDLLEDKDAQRERRINQLFEQSERNSLLYAQARQIDRKILMMMITIMEDLIGKVDEQATALAGVKENIDAFPAHERRNTDLMLEKIQDVENKLRIVVDEFRRVEKTTQQNRCVAIRTAGEVDKAEKRVSEALHAIRSEVEEKLADPPAYAMELRKEIDACKEHTELRLRHISQGKVKESPAQAVTVNTSRVAADTPLGKGLLSVSSTFAENSLRLEKKAAAPYLAPAIRNFYPNVAAKTAGTASPAETKGNHTNLAKNSLATQKPPKAQKKNPVSEENFVFVHACAFAALILGAICLIALIMFPPQGLFSFFKSILSLR